MNLLLVEYLLGVIAFFSFVMAARSGVASGERKNATQLSAPTVRFERMERFIQRQAAGTGNDLQPGTTQSKDPKAALNVVERNCLCLAGSTFSI